MPYGYDYVIADIMLQLLPVAVIVILIAIWLLRKLIRFIF